MTKNYIPLTLAFLIITGCNNKPYDDLAKRLNGKWLFDGFYVGDSLLLDTFSRGTINNYETNTTIKSIIIRDQNGFRLENSIKDSLILKLYVDSVLLSEYVINGNKGIYKYYSLDLSDQRLYENHAIDSCELIISDSGNYIIHHFANRIHRSRIIELSDTAFVFEKGDQNTRYTRIK